MDEDEEIRRELIGFGKAVDTEKMPLSMIGMW